MSHWSTVETEFTKEESLVDALKEMFPGHRVVKNSEVKGYSNSQKADVVLKGDSEEYRTYDIGFKLSKSGTYSQVADWYGLDWLGDKQSFQARLKQSYAKSVVKRRARKLGWTIKEKQEEDGIVRLSLSKY